MKIQTLITSYFLLFASSILQAQKLKPFSDSNQKWGYKNIAGNIVISPKYNYVDDFADGLAPVNLGGKWLENEDHISGGKWGYIDITGKEIVPLKYDDARKFKQGVAMIGTKTKVSDTIKYGLIDKFGKQILAPKYNYIYEPINGFAAIELNGKAGLIDIATGKEILPPSKYNSLDLNYLTDELIKAGIGKQNNQKYGLIDKSGKEIIPLIYDEITPFKNGRAKVSIGKHPNSKRGILDKTGKEIIPLKYKAIWEDGFKEGLALFQMPDNKFGFVDANGKEIIPPLTKYENVNQFQVGIGLAKVFVGKFPNSKGGFIDKTGEEVIETKYDHLGSHFSDGLISVGIGKKPETKFGYIDQTGKEIIPISYKQASNFSNGKAQVTDFNNRKFFIDKTGKEIN